MIKLNKLPLPQHLQDKLDEWERTGHQSASWRDSGIKAVLIEETNAKCAYCESYIPHVASGDVEHILPKSKHPTLRFQWNNLTLACEVCNRYHKNSYAQERKLLDPYETVEPSAYLSAHDATLLSSEHSPDTVRSELTLEKLGLNRAHLVEKRQMELGKMKIIIEAWKDATPATQLVLTEEIHELYEPRQEYSFIIKSYLAKCDFPVS